MNIPSILPIIQSTSSRIINNTTMSLLGYSPNFSNNSENRNNQFYEIEQIIKMAEKIESIIGEKPALCGNIETVSNLFTKKLNKRFIQEVKNNGYGIINNYFGYKIYVIDEQDIGTIIACNEKDLIKNIQEKYGKGD